MLTRGKILRQAIERVRWGSATEFDIRNIADPSNADECLLQCDSDLRDIYCYKEYGMSVIAKHSDYVRNVAVDFKKKREDERPGEPSFRPILLQFRNLTRLRLKLDDDRYDYFYFIQHLPQTMLEIHLLGDTYIPRNPPKKKKSRKPAPTQPKKFLDLTKFSQLQALTLTAFKFERGSLFGLERLANLKYLRLDNTLFDWSYFDAMKLYKKLEYLSLECCRMRTFHLQQILNANENLKVLNIAEHCNIRDEDLFLWKLKKLKILCLSKTRWDMAGISSSESLEYFDCSGVPLENSHLSAVIDAFPTLKGLNIADCSFSPELIDIIEEKLVNREDGSILNVYVGEQGNAEAILSKSTSQLLKCHKFPEKKYARLFDYDYWNGWYTNDEEAMESDGNSLLPVIAPMRDGSSPIQLIADDSLENIFLQLPPTERLVVEQVCKRWKTVARGSWYRQKSLDARDTAPHEAIQTIITRSGRYLQGLYYYKSCGLSQLPVKIPNLRNLAIDFQKRLCQCPSHNEEIDPPSFNLILNQFSNLTRVMFKAFLYHRMHSFLEHLPETMKEIHILNQNNSSEYMRESSNCSSIINLSKFINLRALTLSRLWVSEYRCRSFSIEGMELLEKLNYLRLVVDTPIECSKESLGNIRNLEHLHIELKCTSFDVTTLVQNNRNLRYLSISAPREFSNEALDATFTLENLEYLRFDRLTIPRNFRLINAIKMPNLKFLQWESFSVPVGIYQQIFVESPNLEVVIVARELQNVKEFLEVAENTALMRTGDVPLKVYLGHSYLREVEELKNTAPHVLLNAIPPWEHHIPVEHDFWGGWYTKD